MKACESTCNKVKIREFKTKDNLKSAWHRGEEMLKGEVNPNYEKRLDFLIFGALFVLAMGLVTSTSVLALSHILMILPCLYFATITDWKKMPRSAWGLGFFILVIILSILINLPIMKNGLKPILKAKYFIYGIFSIVPLAFFLKNKLSEKRKQILINTILIASVVAMVAGTIGKNTGYNPILMKKVNTDRNAGLMGMVLNFSHNLSYFMVFFATSLICFWKKISSRQKIIYLIILLLNLFSLYTTYTRGAILAFIAGVICYFLKDLKKLIIAIIVCAMIGVIGYFANYNNFQRQGSNDERFSLWQTALSAYQEKPILGWGYLNFEHHSLEIKHRYGYAKPDYGGHAHNSIFEVMASTGTIGLIAFLTWIGFWVNELFKRTDRWARVELAMLGAFFVGGQTQATISLGINLFFIMAVYSVSAARTILEREKYASPNL